MKKAVPHYVQAAGVIVRRVGNLPREEVLLAQRPTTGLLGGMWEFPNGRVDQDPARGLAKALKDGYNLRLGVKRKVRELGEFQHAYTHFKVTVHAYLCDLASSPHAENLKWVALQDLADYPMGKLDRQIANTVMQRNRT